VLTLARRQEIHLPPPWRECARILAAHAEENELGHVAEIETDPAAIWAAVRADFEPDEIGLVGKAPRLHHREAVGQERIRDPQIKVRRRRRELLDRQHHNLRKRHRGVTAQPAMLGRDLPGLVGKLPRRVGENGAKASM
jgi:hypothetical protein